jgi:uncharacterized membrane protein
MIQFLTTVNRVLFVLVPSLLQAIIWHGTTVREQSRGQTFFGARVQPGFVDSNTGQAILKQFRWRLWIGSLVAVASALIPGTLALFAGFMIGSLAGSVAFALAHRKTRQIAVGPTNSTVRVASLFAKAGPETLWLGVLDWLAMLVPPLIPAATLLFLILHSNPMPAGFPTGRDLFPVFFGLILTLMCTANQWVLRFRARASDWAPTPGASHKYRTYLGVMQALVFAFITCQLCVLVALPRPIDMPTYFLIGFPAQALWLFCIWKMRFWLTKHLARDSSDPMPDVCWKWGFLYFNPNDPALVVPLRTGVGQSFNYARPSVWVVGGPIAVLTLASIVRSAALMTRIVP